MGRQCVSDDCKAWLVNTGSLSRGAVLTSVARVQLVRLGDNCCISFTKSCAAKYISKGGPCRNP